jgi:enoyl-CoA hydratase/carnithine racemase
MGVLETANVDDIRLVIRDFARPFAAQANPDSSNMASNRQNIDRHFSHASIASICASLADDDGEFAQQTLSVMQKRSPLLMCVTLEQLRRGASLSVAECLRMERTMVRHCFKHGEVLEGVRALVVDKDNAPRWSPAGVGEVNASLVESFFAQVWPDYAHPLRHLD